MVINGVFVRLGGRRRLMLEHSPLILRATHEATLKYISRGVLEEHGIDDLKNR